MVCIFTTENNERKIQIDTGFILYWKKRNEFDQFVRCFQELKKHEDTFFSYVRMGVSSIEELLKVLSDNILNLVIASNPNRNW